MINAACVASKDDGPPKAVPLDFLSYSMCYNVLATGLAGDISTGMQYLGSLASLVEWVSTRQDRCSRTCIKGELALSFSSK
jgi:hypothetical protein